MFMSFFAMIDQLFSQKVKLTRSDSGIEFNCMKTIFRIMKLFIKPLMLVHRNNMNVARALRFQRGLSIYFWGVNMFWPLPI